MKKTFLLLTAVLFCMASAFAQDCDYSGTTGTLQWCLKNGTLTISGNGTMPNYESPFQYPPWYAYRTSITAIEIGSGVLSIGREAFRGCNILPTLTIPNTVGVIGVLAFADCTSLQNVTIEEGPTQLTFTLNTFSQNSAFYGSSIGNLYLGRRVNDISAYSFNQPFKNNDLLYSLTIGKEVTEIYGYYFNGCVNLKSLTIENGSKLRTIREYAFNGCKELVHHLVIPDTVGTIGERAFNGCSKLLSLFIPESVHTIGRNAFASCTSLQNVTIEDGLRQLTFTPGTFSEQSAFYGSSIENLYLGRNVNDISGPGFNQPFKGNNLLYSLTIGINVDNLPNYYFSGCSSITQITSFPCLPPKISNNTFNSVNKNIPVYVNCCSAYQTAQFWNEFTNYWDINTQKQCIIVGIGDITLSQFVIYPNPTTGELRIENGELRMGNEDYQIFSVLGQLLMQGKLQTEITIINVASLANGIYYLRIGDQTVKFVKE